MMLRVVLTHRLAKSGPVIRFEMLRNTEVPTNTLLNQAKDLVKPYLIKY